MNTVEAAFLLTGICPPPVIYINDEARYASSFPTEEIRQEVARLLGSAS